MQFMHMLTSLHWLNVSCCGFTQAACSDQMCWTARASITSVSTDAHHLLHHPNLGSFHTSLPIAVPQKPGILLAWLHKTYTSRLQVAGTCAAPHYDNCPTKLVAALKGQDAQPDKQHITSARSEQKHGCLQTLLQCCQHKQTILTPREHNTNNNAATT